MLCGLHISIASTIQIRSCTIWCSMQSGLVHGLLGSPSRTGHVLGILFGTLCAPLSKRFFQSNRGYCEVDLLPFSSRLALDIPMHLNLRCRCGSWCGISLKFVVMWVNRLHLFGLYCHRKRVVKNSIQCHKHGRGAYGVDLLSLDAFVYLK